MKYSDMERVDRIKTYTRKILEYVNDKNITREIIDSDETVQWTLNTPLYNIGEHAYYLSDEL